MLSLKRKPFENSQDLLKIYRMAYEKAKYVKDFDEKILAFNDEVKSDAVRINNLKTKST